MVGNWKKALTRMVDAQGSAHSGRGWGVVFLLFACLTGYASSPYIFFNLEDAPVSYSLNTMTYHVYDRNGNDVSQGRIEQSIGGSYYFDADGYENAQYSFAIELNNASEPGTSWISDQLTWSYCQSVGAYRSIKIFDLKFATFSNFTYVVPEPSAGLLLLVGAGLLALRRRRAFRGCPSGCA